MAPDLWERLDLIDEVNSFYYANPEEFASYGASGWRRTLYLIKVNIALFFGWYREEEGDTSYVTPLATIDGRYDCGYDCPSWAQSWEEIMTPMEWWDISYSIRTESNW